MELLVVEPLDPEVLDWLSMRHAVVYAPHLAHDPYEFRASLARVRGMVLPPSVAVDRAVLRAAPQLLTVGRLSAGAENLDLESCARSGVEVVRPPPPAPMPKPNSPSARCCRCCAACRSSMPRAWPWGASSAARWSASSA
jgi:lactate dehydrogenase-like 2-hydroxyacid dehydrogenase